MNRVKFITRIAGLLIFVSLPTAIRATTYTVTNTNDSGAGSLRDAINQANATSADDTINFAIPANDPNCTGGVCTINLISGNLIINAVSTAGKLTIANSTGASNLLISPAPGNTRAFYINTGADLTLNGVTIKNGTGYGGNKNDGLGGAVYSNGALAITNSVVSSSSANAGGGIYNDAQGTLTITNSTVSGNTAFVSHGGGIYNLGALTISNSTISGNAAKGGRGGGVYNYGNGSSLSLTGSTVSGNQSSDYGGGVFTQNTSVTLTNSIFSGNSSQTDGAGIDLEYATNPTLSGLTVSGNTANSNGGGVYFYFSTATLTNSTISNNTARFTGGVVNESGTLTIQNSTVSGNSSSSGQGGILNFSGTINLTSVTVTRNSSTYAACTTCAGGVLNFDARNAVTNLRNTIVAGNTVANSSSGPDFYGSVSSTSSYNLIGSSQGMTGISNGANGNQVGTPANPLDPRLAPLANNGGTTQTHALLSDSPAIDKGNSFGLTTDQRGSTRPVDLPNYPNAPGGDGTDIGAFEAQAMTPASAFQFNQSSYSVAKACASTTITVTRSGDTSQPATVDYQTQDGTATQKSDFTIALGTLSFAAGETSKTFSVLISMDGFAKGTETATLMLTNPQNAALGAQSTAQLQITDTSTSDSPSNPIDDATIYVCQHYHDFLNREADQGGLNFWINQITSCNGDAACIDIKRQNVSAAYFLSREFQETGFFVIKVQRAAFGKVSNDASKRISYVQFLRDAQAVGKGFIDGQAGADQILDQNKTAYVQAVVASSAFAAKYPTTLSASAYVDALYQTANVTPQGTEQQDAITAFGSGDTAGRAAALRKVAESNSVKQAEFNAAFVLLQYFGYLRRNPTDLPDTSDAGYQFWLNKLNSFNGDYIASQMVRSFIVSQEYRKRFGAQ